MHRQLSQSKDFSKGGRILILKQIMIFLWHLMRILILSAIGIILSYKLDLGRYILRLLRDELYVSQGFAQDVGDVINIVIVTGVSIYFAKHIFCFLKDQLIKPIYKFLKNSC